MRVEVVETAEVDDSLRVVAVADGEEGSVVGLVLREWRRVGLRRIPRRRLLLL